MARCASNTRRERRDVIFRRATYSAETGTNYERGKAAWISMRPEMIDSNHEAGRQKFRLKDRVSDHYPYLGRFVVANETGVGSDICCADLC